MATNNDSDAAFTGQQQLIEAQFTLYAYICALVGDAQDARDVLQETNLKLCRELAVYDPSKPFLPWAKRVAYYEVLSFRTKRARDRLILTDGAFFEAVAADSEQAFDGLERDAVYLDLCLSKLNAWVQELVKARYFQGMAVNELARLRRCSVNAVSLLLFKARRALSECIRTQRLKEAQP